MSFTFTPPPLPSFRVLCLHSILFVTPCLLPLVNSFCLHSMSFAYTTPLLPSLSIAFSKYFLSSLHVSTFIPFLLPLLRVFWLLPDLLLLHVFCLHFMSSTFTQSLLSSLSFAFTLSLLPCSKSSTSTPCLLSSLHDFYLYSISSTFIPCLLPSLYIFVG